MSMHYILPQRNNTISARFKATKFKGVCLKIKTCKSKREHRQITKTLEKAHSDIFTAIPSALINVPKILTEVAFNFHLLPLFLRVPNH